MQQLRATFDRAHACVREQLEATHQRRKEYHDRNARAPEYQVGDLIWVHQPTPRVSESLKLHRPWTVPYRVLKNMGMNTFRVQHCVFQQKRQVLHADRMKPCHHLPDPEQARQEERARRRPGRPTNVPPVEEEGRGFSLIEVKGDLFDAPDQYTLGHCVARDLRMGAGIAKEFKTRFGGVQELKKQNVPVGGVAMLRRDNRLIIYMVTKNRSYHKPTYANLRRSLIATRKKLDEFGCSKLAIPMLGCGLDKLAEDRVKDILHDVFGDSNVEVRIYRKPESPKKPEKPRIRSRPLHQCEGVGTAYHSYGTRYFSSPSTHSSRVPLGSPTSSSNSPYPYLYTLSRTEIAEIDDVVQPENNLSFEEDTPIERPNNPRENGDPLRQKHCLGEISDAPTAENGEEPREKQVHIVRETPVAELEENRNRTLVVQEERPTGDPPVSSPRVDTTPAPSQPGRRILPRREAREKALLKIHFQEEV